MRSKSPQFETLEDRHLLTAYLVEDINKNHVRPINYGRDYDTVRDNVVEVGDFSYFALQTATGLELWRTDGNGANVVKSIENADRLHLAPSSDNGLVYIACDRSIFASDCTLSNTDGENTTVLKQFESHWVHGSFDGGLYFLADSIDPTTSHRETELWISDGSIEGTRAIAGSKRIYEVREAGDSLLIFGSDGDSQYTVQQFRDGQLSDISIGDHDPQTDFLYGFGESLFLWRSTSREWEILDGPMFETSRIVRPSIPESEEVVYWAPHMNNGETFFRTNADGTHSYWRSDGTVAGTNRLLSSETHVYAPYAFGNDLYVVEIAAEGILSGSQSKLWKLDNATGGFQELLVSSKPFGEVIQLSSGATFFQASSKDAVDLHLLSGDESTLLLSDHELIGEVDGGLLVSNSVGSYSRGLRFFDSETTQTRSLATYDVASGSSDPQAKMVVNDILVFAANNNEIHTFDGVTRSTIASVGIQEFEYPNFSQSLGTSGVIGSVATYLERDGSTGNSWHLWGTDGTSENTFEIWEGIQPSMPQGESAPILTVSAGVLFLSMGNDILITDSTVAGTRLLFEGAPQSPIGNGRILDIAQAQAGVVFTVATDDGIDEVWRSDGTLAGTQRIFTASRTMGIGTGSPSGIALPQVVESDRPKAQRSDAVYFLDRGMNATDLVRYDGNEAQVVQSFDFQATELIQTSVGMFATRVVSHGARKTTQIVRIYEQDPTREPELIGKLVGTESISDWIEFGGNLSFRRQLTSTSASEVWTTDGTAQGTRLIQQFEGGPAEQVAIGDTLFFFSSTLGGGTKLSATDGTITGTNVYELGDSPFTTFAHDLIPYKGKVYFTAADRKHGAELWAINDPTPIRGDVDGDGKVAFEDFKILAANFGTGTLRSEGDVNGDGRVTFEDFVELSANFGRERTTTIPESLATIAPQPLDIVAAAWATDDSDRDAEVLEFAYDESAR